MNASETYTEKDFQTLEWQEHIRKRPGMYIGKLGDGSAPDDGIYVLLKEVVDNSVDEFAMGYGKSIHITLDGDALAIRDYGRGIPLGKLVDAAGTMNTGAKYDSKAFQKTVGLNGVGIKAVNALSSSFYIHSFRDGQSRSASFERGRLQADQLLPCDQKNGTLVRFVPDVEIFGTYQFSEEFMEQMLKNYSYLNAGLRIALNNTEYISKNGLLDLLNDNLNDEPLYPPVYLKGDDIEVALTHGNGYGESIYSFVNGQNTTQGGTHLSAFRESISKTIKEFYRRDFDPSDVRQSIVAAISIRVQDPVFESQTKTKLGSKEMGPEGPSVRNFINDFLKEHLDNFLHKNAAIAEALLKKILESEKERKAISGVQKLARERAKKANLHNKKLRDCR
ncbi:MAG: ATP-binding protein, partial [Bacteroidetes bacterium]|nr:ATP-binding protein [Bacteroidota bacterium]